MKAAKNGDKDKFPEYRNTPRSRERRIYRDTIKAEQDKIDEIKRRGLESWRTEELIKPIQKRLDKRTKELDEYNKSLIEDRRAREAATPTPTFKGGGKMKSIKKK